MDGAEPPNPRPADDDVPARFQVDFRGRTLLGTYRVVRPLAEGGMGSVHLAEDTNLGRPVVVKVPHARFLGEPGFRTRFRREVSELVRLEHPHVVRILARGEEDGVPFFVLQYLGGGSLEERLRAGVERPERVWSWLEPIAKTLDFLHSRSVVHRDVKPANILFDEQEHVFLSDFGVVKALGNAAESERTAAGTGVGSPSYMAPEQILGGDVTGAADQYALASTVHEALAGEPPFGRGTPLEVLLRKEREQPRALAAAVPAPCTAAVRRALSRDPAAGATATTARGGVFDVQLKAEKVPADELLDPVAEAEDSLRYLSVVFPEEPVGKGAIWDVSRLAALYGFRYQETTTYEVTSVEGDRVHLNLKVRNSSPEQKFELPVAKKGVMDMRSLSGSGSATAVVALDRPMLLELELNTRLRLEFGTPSGTQTTELSLAVSLKPR